MYLLNLRSKTIHKHPTLEVCNMDACKKKKKIKDTDRLFIYDYRLADWKRCKHCFK